MDILSRLVYYAVRLLNSTYRYRYLGLEHLSQAKEINSQGSYLLGVWHQNMLPGILCQTAKPYVVIVSKSKDANPVAYTCERLGHKVVRGSSRSRQGKSKGGLVAKSLMVAELKKGIPGAVTVDGPKGPAKCAKGGIFVMATETGAPLIPYAPIAEKYWSFKSWDEFRLPKPFSRIIIYYGPPQVVVLDSDQQDLAYYQRSLEQALAESEERTQGQFVNWKDLSKENSFSSASS